MPMTPTARQAIDAVVSVFETGRLPSSRAYATATLLPDGAGISYGLHQATRDTMTKILVEYEHRGGAYAGEIRRVSAGHKVSESQVYATEASAPGWLRDLLATLRLAGEDSVMQSVQRDVFSAMYWLPVETYAARIGVLSPLGHLALYDTAIQSGMARIDALRPTFRARPPTSGGFEPVWVTEFVQARHDWLASFTSSSAAKQALVRKTTYRTTELLRLIRECRWDLIPPFSVRGVIVG